MSGTAALVFSAVAFTSLLGVGGAGTLRRRSKDPNSSPMAADGAQLRANRSIGEENGTFPASGELSIGDYPSWKEASCHSQGEFLCDPELSMGKDGIRMVAQELEALREEVSVRCGQLDSLLAGRDQTNMRNFNLGLAIAEKWPETLADPTAMQNLGMVLMSQWGLMPIYNGVDNDNSVTESYNFREYTTNCPNSAMLIILPRYGEVYLSAPSCEFICNERGGPEVANAVFAAWDAEGLAAGAKAGIREIRRILQEPSPLSLRRNDEAFRRRLWTREWQKRLAPTEFATTLVQRGILLFIIACAIALLFAFAVYSLAPEPRKAFRKA